MRDCKIESGVMPSVGVPRLDYQPRVEMRCTTHGWCFSGIQTHADIWSNFDPARCPIGLIEAATDEAIAKIKAAREPDGGCEFMADDKPITTGPIVRREGFPWPK